LLEPPDPPALPRPPPEGRLGFILCPPPNEELPPKVPTPPPEAPKVELEFKPLCPKGVEVATLAGVLPWNGDVPKPEVAEGGIDEPKGEGAATPVADPNAAGPEPNGEGAPKEDCPVAPKPPVVEPIVLLPAVDDVPPNGEVCWDDSAGAVVLLIPKGDGLDCDPPPKGDGDGALAFGLPNGDTPNPEVDDFVSAEPKGEEAGSMVADPKGDDAPTVFANGLLAAIPAFPPEELPNGLDGTAEDIPLPTSAAILCGIEDPNPIEPPTLLVP